MNLRKLINVSGVLVAALSVLACSMDSEANVSENSVGKVAVSLACWNTQTFFDAEMEGTEYEDYQNLAKWSKDKYLTRLGRLCEVMNEIDADVFVLEEIENVSVVQDIANQFAGKSWKQKNNWRYACFSKEEGSAIGCAVFSRYEITGVKSHSLDLRNLGMVQPSMRPLMEVTVNVDEKELGVYVCHWKSKSGGAEETEVWRDWQESLCACRLKQCSLENPNEFVVLCGDFNRNAMDFVFTDGNVKLRGVCGDENLNNAWLDESGKCLFDIGSYFYNGSWEYIDNVLCSKNVKISAFGPRAQTPWANENSIPVIYKLYSGEGYSDHLPLLCTLTF